MTLKQLRIKLLKKDKSLIWLAKQLGYSRTYLYRVIEVQNQRELERIKKILEEC